MHPGPRDSHRRERLLSSGMAAEWVAAVSTSVLGIVGVLATYFTAKQARTSQEKGQERAFSEERLRELVNQRRKVYAAFLSAVRELDLVSGAHLVIATTARTMFRPRFEAAVDSGGHGDVSQMTLQEREALIDQLFREAQKALFAQYGVWELKDWLRHVGEIGGLFQQVALLAGAEVRRAAQAVMECVPLTTNTASELSDAQREQVRELPVLIRMLTEAMSAEVAGTEGAAEPRS